MADRPEAAASTFTITYVPNGGKDPWDEPCFTFPEEAKAAFNAAAAIWANLLQSPVPITINACWATLSSSSTLGYSGGGPLHRNFTGAPVADTWYTGALANALYGSDLSPADADMHITFNSNFPWYYGTDGNPPLAQYDLMTVVLHEIGHGLNFSGSAAYSGDQGSLRWYGYPGIYDTFMKDGAGNLLTSYSSPSAALGSVLTGGNLWFHGPKAMAANGGRVKIYAPGTWAGGSSYSHLDYATFNNTANQGPVTMGLMEDLGWPTATTPPVLYADFAGDGLYSYNGTAWTYINSVHPSLIAASGSTLYADFAGYGLYSYNGTTWTLINTVHPASMVASGSTLYADFAGYGLYSYNGATWTYINSVHPTSMTASGDKLYADFAGYGLYSYNGTTWTLINAAHPASMAAGF
jgi:hypothetical protein